jgi:hypothetical protein
VGYGIENLAPVIGSVAPILTFFRKGQDAEAYMSCLKIVDTKAGSVSEGSGGKPNKNSAPGIIVPMFSYLVVVGVAIALVL